MLSSTNIHLALSAVLAAATFLPIAAHAEEGKSRTVILDQGWSADQRAFYYYTSQGSLLMPAAFLEALESEFGGRFMGADNLSRFGWIFDAGNSAKNPYGWPIGFTIDTDATSSLPQAGLTCAACHNGEISYRGTRIRIDGGQSPVDLNAFSDALNTAVAKTASDSARRTRFIERATLLGYPKSRVEKDFSSVAEAFNVGTRLRQMGAKLGATVAGAGRLDALMDIANSVFATGLDTPANLRPGDAPQSYPHVWDIWRFDWVQYNAIGRTPMSRNLTEGIGSGGVHPIDPKTGKLLPEATRWKTTLNVRNMDAIEQELRTLKTPPWPEDVLGKIDRARADNGRTLFTENCAGCHGIQTIKGVSPVEWHVPLVKLTKVGTDPGEALNFASRRYDGRKIGAGERVGIPEGLYPVLAAVQRQAYLDAGVSESEAAAFDNFRRGANGANTAPCGYKARPLMGVWATAPFLHNGAVPTVYDLLSETRPATFRFGGNDIDPVKLGLGATTADNATTFDPNQPGNSNQGHWFTNEQSRPGRIGRAFSDDERYALIEYLKAAAPANYPSREIDQPAPAACSDDRNWADKWPRTGHK